MTDSNSDAAKMLLSTKIMINTRLLMSPHEKNMNENRIKKSNTLKFKARPL